MCPPAATQMSCQSTIKWCYLHIFELAPSRQRANSLPACLCRVMPLSHCQSNGSTLRASISKGAPSQRCATNAAAHGLHSQQPGKGMPARQHLQTHWFCQGQNVTHTQFRNTVTTYCVGVTFPGVWLYVSLNKNNVHTSSTTPMAVAVSGPLR
jgi:hypothetical protein